MIAKRAQEEKVRTRTRATCLLADEGPAEGDRRGWFNQKRPNIYIFEGTLHRTVFQKCGSHHGGEHIFAKHVRKFELKGV